MKVVLGTNNPGKVAEFRALAQDSPWLELLPAPPGFSPVENGQTFLQNARLKAKAASALAGLPAMADDSGLCVDALNGSPGVLSSRYSKGDDADRRHKLLGEMKDVPPGARRAAFTCAMVLVDASGAVLHETVKNWEGSIAHEEKGENGFGYDPVFCVPGCEMTAAELSSRQKNKLSHRAQAFADMLAYLEGLKNQSASAALGAQPGLGAQGSRLQKRPENT